MSTTPKDFLAEIEKYLLNLGSSDWIEVYRREKTETQSISLTSGLVPQAKSQAVLGASNWVFDPQHLKPGCVRYGDGTVAYRPFGSDEGFEPLIIEREFHDIKPAYVEIREEFRLFHNLYFDSLLSKLTEGPARRC
jgi:hypothetical protein